MQSDNLGPLYPPETPALREPQIIDAKFRVVLSPYEKLVRRLDRFEWWGTLIGCLLAGALMVWLAPYISDAVDKVSHPIISAVFGKPPHW